MSIKIRRLVRFVLCLFVLTLFASAAMIFAQGVDVGTNALPVVGSANNVKEMATPFIVGLSTKYTIVMTILAAIGFLRLIFKPLMTLIEAAVKATPSTNDDAFLAKCESSAIFRWAMWLLDWLGSIKPPSVATTNPALTSQGVNK